MQLPLQNGSCHGISAARELLWFKARSCVCVCVCVSHSGHEYQEALEVAVKGQELLRRMRVPKKDPAWGMFEELTSAIKEAAGNAAAAAGAAGIKPGF